VSWSPRIHPKTALVLGVLEEGSQVVFGKRTARRLCIVAVGFIAAVPVMCAPTRASSGTLEVDI